MLFYLCRDRPPIAIQQLVAGAAQPSCCACTAFSLRLYSLFVARGGSCCVVLRVETARASSRNSVCFEWKQRVLRIETDDHCGLQKVSKCRFRPTREQLRLLRKATTINTRWRGADNAIRIYSSSVYHDAVDRLESAISSSAQALTRASSSRRWVSLASRR